MNRKAVIGWSLAGASLIGSAAFMATEVQRYKKARDAGQRLNQIEASVQEAQSDIIYEQTDQTSSEAVVEDALTDALSLEYTIGKGTLSIESLDWYEPSVGNGYTFSPSADHVVPRPVPNSDLIISDRVGMGGGYDRLLDDITNRNLTLLQVHMWFLEIFQTDDWRAQPEHAKIAHALALEQVHGILSDRVGREPLPSDWAQVTGHGVTREKFSPHMIPYESLDRYMRENWQEKE